MTNILLKIKPERTLKIPHMEAVMRTAAPCTCVVGLCTSIPGTTHALQPDRPTACRMRLPSPSPRPASHHSLTCPQTHKLHSGKGLPRPEPRSWARGTAPQRQPDGQAAAMSQAEAPATRKGSGARTSMPSSGAQLPDEGPEVRGLPPGPLLHRLCLLRSGSQANPPSGACPQHLFSVMARTRGPQRVAPEGS